MVDSSIQTRRRRHSRSRGRSKDRTAPPPPPPSLDGMRPASHDRWPLRLPPHPTQHYNLILPFHPFWVFLSNSTPFLDLPSSYNFYSLGRLDRLAALLTNFTLGLPPNLYLFILFYSRDKTKASSQRDMCLKQRRQKETPAVILLRPPRVRCAQVTGGRRTPYKLTKKEKRASKNG
jgi:hypothetical protein